MFEHFTEGARRVLVLAQEEAQDLHDSSVDPEHLLLAMLREKEGIAARALAAMGVDYDRTRQYIRDGGRRTSASELEPLSRSTMSIIETSGQISWSQADGSVGTEHLLIALLGQEDETIESVLAQLDITPHEVRQQVDTLLAERSP